MFIRRSFRVAESLNQLYQFSFYFFFIYFFLTGTNVYGGDVKSHYYLYIYSHYEDQQKGPVIRSANRRLLFPEISILWNVCCQCGCCFLRYLEELNGLQFTDNITGPSIRHTHNTNHKGSVIKNGSLYDPLRREISEVGLPRRGMLGRSGPLH